METVKIFGIEQGSYLVNAEKFQEVLERYRLDVINKPVLMLPYGAGNTVGREIRYYFFDLARGKDGYLSTEPVLRPAPEQPLTRNLQATRIFSFGKCNVHCPYCKRDCQFIDDDGNVIGTTEVKLEDLFRMAERAVAMNEVVRFSGGDPVMFQRICLAISAYVSELYGKRTSIAHNGSGPNWVKQMLPMMDSAAIDLKAVLEKMGKVMGVSQGAGEKIYHKSLETQALFSDPTTNPNRAILDVRTPVFGDTTFEDMMRLGEDITKGDPRIVFWTWRLYKPVQGCDWPVPDKDVVVDMLKKVSAKYPNHWMGIRAKWHGGGMLYFRGGQVVNTEEKLDTNEAIGSGNR